MEPVTKSPLDREHRALGARMIEFGGWRMPLCYGSIVEEHVATRTSAGIFDISHMGRFAFRGDSAVAFLDRMLTRSALDMTPGQIRYALAADDSGRILDDVLVYRHADTIRDPAASLVVNAANRCRVRDWLESQASAWTYDHGSVELRDETLESAMIAVQGPRALELVAPLVDPDPSEFGYYQGGPARICGVDGYASRTGYTGEDGCELIVPRESAEPVWQRMVEAGKQFGALPAGLGCRDTLRLEAALPLYGHELTEETNPFAAGLGFAVSLDNHDFVGREPLLARRADPRAASRRVGMVLEGRRPARPGQMLLHDGRPVGQVTSGTLSPSLDQPIAMGYVVPEAASVGTRLAVDIRGHAAAAEIVRLPFYRRPA
jgi:aminomethyltransferase